MELYGNLEQWGASLDTISWASGQRPYWWGPGCATGTAVRHNPPYLHGAAAKSGAAKDPKEDP